MPNRNFCKFLHLKCWSPFQAHVYGCFFLSSSNVMSVGGGQQCGHFCGYQIFLSSRLPPGLSLIFFVCVCQWPKFIAIIKIFVAVEIVVTVEWSQLKPELGFGSLKRTTVIRGGRPTLQLEGKCCVSLMFWNDGQQGGCMQATPHLLRKRFVLGRMALMQQLNFIRFFSP